MSAYVRTRLYIYHYLYRPPYHIISPLVSLSISISPLVSLYANVCPTVSCLSLPPRSSRSPFPLYSPNINYYVFKIFH